jgi:glyoxylase-like metal-dependent hydrolase (beta-lactamase superfamily II)
VQGSLSPTERFARHVGNGVHLIDTHYVRPGLAASHLVIDEGRAAFVDSGPAPSAPRLLAALDELDIDRSQVDYVILTHVHLDHAGGAGQLMQALPNARAVLHPRGAPHLIDPAKLVAGSIEVYGREPFERMYGEIVPIPAERVLVAEDRMRLKLGNRTFEFVDTPGHARHHHSVIDLDYRDIYSGDTFGISYRDFDTARGPFIMPTTTPVQFDPQALHASINRLMDYGPRRMILMHFGPVQDLERLARELHASIVEFVRIARRHPSAPDRSARIGDEMFRYLSVRLDEHGFTGDLARRRELLSDDVTLNTQGLVVWLDRS